MLTKRTSPFLHKNQLINKHSLELKIKKKTILRVKNIFNLCIRLLQHRIANNYILAFKISTCTVHY